MCGPSQQQGKRVRKGEEKRPPAKKGTADFDGDAIEEGTDTLRLGFTEIGIQKSQPAEKTPDILDLCGNIT